MKIINTLISIAFIFTLSTVDSQNLAENEDGRNGIFNMEEFSNIHIWFTNQVYDMRMNDKLQLEYDTLLGFYNEKITRLNKEEGVTKEEYISNMKVQIGALNSRIEPILSEEQNKKHLEIMAILERAVINKFYPNLEQQEETMEVVKGEKTDLKKNIKSDDLIGIFTLEEFSNLHIWLNNQVEDMKMSDDVQTEYDALWSFYKEKITRLDKEDGVSADKYIENMNVQIAKLNSRLKPILSEEQHKKHLGIMSNLESAVENKLLIND